MELSPKLMPAPEGEYVCWGMKSRTMLDVFLRLQVEKSETKGPHQKYKRIKNQTRAETPPLTGIIYINASSKTKMCFSIAGVGAAGRAGGNKGVLKKLLG